MSPTHTLTNTSLEDRYSISLMSSSNDGKNLRDLNKPKDAHIASKPIPLSQLDSHGQILRTPDEESPIDATFGEQPGSNATVVREQQRWNSPKINKYRLGAVFWAFVSFGMSDASYGALLPSLEAYYRLTYIVVSLVFLAPFAGYTVAALFSDRIHMLAGQRGVAIVAAISRLLSFVVLSVHPPYPVLIVALVFTGLGNGLYDGAYNAWVGDLQNNNEILGVMHGLYGAGATIAPVIATSMVVKYHLPWYSYYYIMIGMSFMELVLGGTAFWKADANDFKAHNTGAAVGSVSDKGRFRESLRQRPTILISLFLLAYTGSEVSLAGWIVTFLLRNRNAQPFASGLAVTGFWLGITVGRMTLGFVTPRLGERWCVAGYLVACVGLQLIFWLVPQFYVSAIAVALLGFFLGPMFPSAIVALTKLLPKRLHVGAVGFASALGGGGAALLPFAVGAIAQAGGVGVLQPIILALLVLLLILWLLLPRIPKHAHAD